jgi:formate-dependent nitrite reductase membrane component NrfD
MHELTLTRHNPLVDPILHVWSWEIPVYLFLGGWVAGMMAITGYFLLRGRQKENLCVCAVLPGLSLVLLTLGMLALFLDLEHKLYVWRLYMTFEIGSPMSWGAWVLLAVYPVLLTALLIRPPRPLQALVPSLRAWSQAMAGNRALVRAAGVALIVLGAMLGIYTGVLLSALGARPLWNSAILGILFLLSGLSSAAAFTHLVAQHRDEREALARSDNVFLAAELVVLALFLVGLLTSTAVHIQAARLVLGGPFTAVFWVFVVGLGLVIPLVVQSLAVSHRVAHTAVAPLLVLAGGLALRVVIVYAGQYSHWAGF